MVGRRMAIRSMFGASKPVVRTCKADNVRLVDRLIADSDDLLDSKEDIQKVSSFFKNQHTLFDNASGLVSAFENEMTYLRNEKDATEAYDEIKSILEANPFNYNRIPDLNNLIGKVRGAHDKVLKARKENMCTIVDQCLDAVVNKAGDKCDSIVSETRGFYANVKQDINSKTMIAMVELMANQIYRIKDAAFLKIDEELTPKPASPTPAQPQPQKFYKTAQRQLIFSAKRLETEADVDAYVEEIRKTLKDMLRNSDGIEIK